MLSRMAAMGGAGQTDTFVMTETAAPLPESLAMRLLQAGVPLSLLLDLTSQKGPDSAGISAQERPDEHLTPA
jgi:hypothetical protein